MEKKQKQINFNQRCFVQLMAQRLKNPGNFLKELKMFFGKLEFCIKNYFLKKVLKKLKKDNAYFDLNVIFLKRSSKVWLKPRQNEFS